MSFFPILLLMLAFIALTVLLIRDSRTAERRLNASSAIKAAQRLELMQLCQDSGNALLRAIRDANPQRGFQTMGRRMLKIGEEYGEASEAYLVFTSTAMSRKKKTKDDIREECMDIAIVALDCALTRMPGEETLTEEDVEFICMELLATKLAKWKHQRDTQTAITDNAGPLIVDDAV